jgi:hypothetical protein
MESTRAIRDRIKKMRGEEMKCMKCKKTIHFWQKAYKMFSFDYIAWHWACQYPDGQTEEDEQKQAERKMFAIRTFGRT